MSSRRMIENEPTIVLGQGKFLRLVSQGTWEYADRVNSSGAVTVVAVTDDRKLLVVEQFRYALGCSALELPAGLVGDIPGEEHEAELIAARRELLEETGYSAAEWTWLTSGPTSPGLATERISFFLAQGLTREHAGGGVDDEAIALHEVPLSSAVEWLAAKHAAGLAIDPKIYAGLYFTGRI